MPLLSAMRDGWGYRDGVAETYLDLLSMDTTHLPFLDFSDSVLTNAKCTMFASMKEPDTAYSNKFTGTVYFKISNSEILQTVDFRLVVFNYMTCT